MKANRYSAILFILFILGTVSAHAGGLKWQEFSSAAGNFTVQMPGEPSYQLKTDKTPVGHIGEHLYTYKNKTLTLTAEYSDLPGIAVFFGGHKTIFKKSKEAFLKSVKGEQVSFTPFKQDGCDGSELVYGTATRFGKVKFLLVHKRLYVLQASILKGESDRSALDRFLKSFRQEYRKPGKKVRRRRRLGSWHYHH